MKKIIILLNLIAIACYVSAQEELNRKDGTIIIVYPDGTWQPKLDNGILKDGRDGQTYRTITIGRQVWMSENLNYQTPNSWIFDNASEPENDFGRLYTWETAKRACPSGWHLPNDDEWQILVENLGGIENAGKKLKAPSDEWKSNAPKKSEVVGFNALPAGARQGYNGSFDYKGVFAFFWSSTANDSKSAWRYYCYAGADGLIRFQYDKNTAVSVRCIKD